MRSLADLSFPAGESETEGGAGPVRRLRSPMPVRPGSSVSGTKAHGSTPPAFRRAPFALPPQPAVFRPAFSAPGRSLLVFRRAMFAAQLEVVRRGRSGGSFPPPTVVPVPIFVPLPQRPFRVQRPFADLPLGSGFVRRQVSGPVRSAEPAPPLRAVPEPPVRR